VIAEATNRVVRDGDATRHAELIALSLAQRKLGGRSLAGCTLYSTVEPCAMCAFPVRETGVGRVVYALGSPVMGGRSKWDVLGDHELSNLMPQAFGAAPEVLAGVLQQEAADLWRRWNPLVWEMARARGCLQEVTPSGAPAQRVPKAGPLAVLRRALAVRPRPAALWQAIRLAFGRSAGR
jgi:tRNA(adenine34) deaminase